MTQPICKEAVEAAAQVWEETRSGWVDPDQHERVKQIVQSAITKACAERDEAFASLSRIANGRGGVITSLAAQLAVMKEALEYWNREYLQRLDECNQSARRCEESGNTHGMNFFQGQRSGLVNHDIALTKLKAALSTLPVSVPGQEKEDKERLDWLSKLVDVRWAAVCRESQPNDTLRDAIDRVMKNEKDCGTKP